MNHIPEKGSVLIRNYGLYSNRNKKKLEELRNFLTKTTEGTRRDPEEEMEEKCPKCGTRMEVVQIFTYDQIPKIIQDYCINNNGPPEHKAVLL